MTEYQPDASGRHTTMLVGMMQPDWDSRGAANTFFDQLTEWDGKGKGKGCFVCGLSRPRGERLQQAAPSDTMKSRSLSPTLFQ